MSVSLLLDIEACPRRRALGDADYSELWRGPGYPPRLSAAALPGVVVHLAIGRVLEALTVAGCSSVQDAKAVGVMRKLGGYSRLLEKCIDDVLTRYADNPRVEAVLDDLRKLLVSRIPEIRGKVQSLVGRRRVAGEVAGARRYREARGARSPLSVGSHPEVELLAPGIGWKGRADLLVLSADRCEIVEFKTGEEREETHRFQLLVYALLWRRDTVLNPSGTMADKLTLAYGHGDVPIGPPSEPDLMTLEQDLVQRGEAARRALGQRPPEARPSVENCRYCGVRQLCDAYWQADTQERFAAEGSQSRFTDMQLRIASKRSLSTWDAVVEASRMFPGGHPVLLRSAHVDGGLSVGDRVRVLDAHVVTTDGEPIVPTVVTMGRLSEAFTVPESVRI